MKIVFVGNFEVPFSTESHHLWTWRKLGHDVIPLQQNRTNEAEVLDACRDAQLLQVTHTHDWPSPLTIQTVDKIRAMGVKSFSYHLDKYFGLPSRTGRYLEHPSFHLDYFFSTDGGNEEGWKEAGINHVWLLGGVVEYGTSPGTYNAADAVDVLFTGSVGYHGEYPFRPKMAAALQANYGNRFRVVNGVREQALNDLYASATVCVGDHIFAGCPRYSSDRLFETIGRGGFLVYPKTEGVTDQIPGLYTYEPQNILSLFHAIDYFLDKAHESDRIARRDAAHDWVKNNATYTHRLREILKVMNLS